MRICLLTSVRLFSWFSTIALGLSFAVAWFVVRGLSRTVQLGLITYRRVCKCWSTWNVLLLFLSDVVTHNDFGSFSLREMMISLKQPYIEWSESILSTGYQPIDRQHEWLLTIINISWDGWLSSFTVRGHPCEHRKSGRYLHKRRAGRSERLRMDPLHWRGGDLREQPISFRPLVGS